MCSPFLQISLNPLHNNLVQPLLLYNDWLLYTDWLLLSTTAYIYHIGPVIVNDDIQIADPPPPEKQPIFFVPRDAQCSLTYAEIIFRFKKKNSFNKIFILSFWDSDFSTKNLFLLRFRSNSDPAYVSMKIFHKMFQISLICSLRFF